MTTTLKDYCSINFTGLTHDHSLDWTERDARNKKEAEESPRNAEPSNGSTTTTTSSNGNKNDINDDNDDDESSYCSAIPILKRHPMYDCLVLVRKYRNCLGGYALEFPIDKIREHERLPTNESAHHDNHQQQRQEQEAQVQRDEGVTENSQDPSGGGGGEDLAGAPGTTGQVKATRGGGGRSSSSCSQRRLVSRFLDGDDPVYRATHFNHCSLTSSMSQTSMKTYQAAAENYQMQQPVTADVGCEPTSAAAAAATGSDEPDARLLFMTQLDERGDQSHLVHVPINGLLDRLESYTRNGIAVDSRVYAFAMGLKTAERMMTTKSMKELQETPI